jgi:NADP-dependent 3-hydroxy acid dehydrogenase YdfG
MPQLKNKIAVVIGGSSGIGPRPPRDSLKRAPMYLSPAAARAEIDKAVAEIGSNATGVKTDIPSSTTSTAFTQIPLGRKTLGPYRKRPGVNWQTERESVCGAVSIRAFEGSR